MERILACSVRKIQLNIFQNSILTSLAREELQLLGLTLDSTFKDSKQNRRKSKIVLLKVYFNFFIKLHNNSCVEVIPALGFVRPVTVLQKPEGGNTSEIDI